jgi:predicted HicB family RNase H-like nuclease
MRIPDELWEAAKVKAAENDESVARVVRRALREYVNGDGKS